MCESTFIELVLFDDLRKALLTFLGGGTADVRSTAALIAVVAEKCHATAGQLREAVRLLEADGRAAANDVLLDLLCHPEMPEDVLVRLAEDGKFIPALGHRARPRRLLEILADKHRHPEAVTTLALNYYGRVEAPAKPFRDFLRRHEDMVILEDALRAGSLDDKKRAIVREVFGDDGESTPSRRKASLR